MMMNINQEWTLFLDRDGVINEQIIGGYVLDFSQFVFVPGAIEALNMLQSSFARIIVLTNQQCVGKAMCRKEDVDEVHRRMLEELSNHGVQVAAVYFCPHRADENCSCRKPQIGLALQAQKDFPAIDFSKSIMVGDALSDMQLGRNCGMKTVFLTKGKTNASDLPLGMADKQFDCLIDFAKYVKQM